MGSEMCIRDRVITALAQAAQELSSNETGNMFHVGVVHSKDSFYGEVEPDSSPMAADIKQRWESYLKCGCLTSEMECAAVFAVCTARRVRCGGILTALWNVERSKAGLPDNITYDSSRAIKCVVSALRKLIAADAKEK